MLYLGILAGSGLLLAPVVASVIYIDATRRGVWDGRRPVLAGVVGFGSFVGFLVPYGFQEQLGYIYYIVLKPRPITVHPLEWVIVSIATGLLLSAVVGCAYLVGSRLRPSQSN